MMDAVRVMELEWGNHEHGVALLADTEFDMVLVSDCGKHLPSTICRSNKCEPTAELWIAVHWPELFSPLCDTLCQVISAQTEVCATD